MKKKYTIAAIMIFAIFNVMSQIAISSDGSNADASAMLHIKANDAGFLPARMTTTERDAIAEPANGLIIFNITTECIEIYNYTWTQICAGTGVAATNGEYTIGTGGSCANTSLNGDYFINVALDGSNTVTIDATVTVTGDWSISTSTINGYSFSGIGTFGATGTQQITLNGSGTPVDSQTDSFTATANEGGGTCTFDIIITDFGTTIVEVTNPLTGEIWMDRSLGATQQATSFDDSHAYGDLYQWGRANDGHEIRTSAVTADMATTPDPNMGNSWDGLFISTIMDWLTSNNNTLWQGASGPNNPCPSGFRIATSLELDNERLSWLTNNLAGAFASPLKWTAGGYRYRTEGTITSVGIFGYSWSSTVSGTSVIDLEISGTNSYIFLSSRRGNALGIRCIKDGTAISNFTIGSGSACANTTVNGNYAISTALDGTNTVTMDVTVTTTGYWHINTTTINGYSFSGSGTFGATGTQQVTLDGSGTPVAVQTDNFTATANAGGSGTCTFDVTVTIIPCGTPISYDGQSYATVEIGTQCWMAENLNIGAMINGTVEQTDNATLEKYCYDDNTSNCDTYGGLYQWDEMMQYVTTEGTQGICPTGWHLPTDAEFMVLEESLGMCSGTGAGCSGASGNRGTDEGSKLAGNEPLWTDGALDQNANFGTTGFTGLPGGYGITGGGFYTLTTDAQFWLSSEDGTDAWVRNIRYGLTQVSRGTNNKITALSVRCVRN